MKLDRTVGLKAVRVWHLNDSLREAAAESTGTPASGPGRWAGAVPSPGQRPAFPPLPLILETPKGTEDGEELDTGT